MEYSSCYFLWYKSIAVRSQNQAVVQALSTTTGSQVALKIKDHSPMGCGAGCLSQAGLLAMNSDFMKPNVLTLQ